jgi:hypothetical protein
MSQPRLSACLLAAAESVRRTSNVPFLSAERKAHDQTLMTIQAELGTAVFEESWAQGRAMTLEQVIALMQPSSGGL